mgnify:FL=1
MQKTYDRKKENICVIYCPTCNGAVAACKESSKDVTAEGDSNLYSPQSFNEQAAFFIKRDVGYKAGKVAEGVKITVCKCKKQRQ